MKKHKMGQWSLKDVNDCKSDSPKNQTHPYVESWYGESFQESKEGWKDIFGGPSKFTWI
jgi:hypothetical protein